MKQSQKIVALALCLLLVLAGGWLLYSRLSQQYRPEAAAPDTSDKTPAPDFTVLDESGNTVRLSDRKGAPVIVNFWATWCGPCQNEMPAFDDAWKEYGDRIQFMMVDLTDGSRDTVDRAKAFIADRGYSFPVYFDTEYSGAMAYGVNSIPATVLIDGDGNIVAAHVGAMSADELKNMLALVLEE